MPEFLALSRLTGLVLSPDGSRLVTSAAALNAERNEYVSALWELDPEGARPARRLTRGSPGERSPAFTSTGDLLFVSARPGGRATTDSSGKEEPPAALWLLPCEGGEARLVGTRPGGVADPVAAEGADVVLVTSMTLPGSVTGADDERRRAVRRDNKVTAMLHTGYPVRFWDHDLGPDQARLLVGDIPSDGGTDWQDLTPTPGNALRETSTAISPDGRTVVADWLVAEPHGASRSTLVAFDVASGARCTLLDDPAHEYSRGRISPDGATVAVTRTRRSSPSRATQLDLVLVPLAGGPARELTAEWDQWPVDVRWTPDSAALIVTADQRGRSPLFRVSAEDGAVTRLTGDHGCYTDPVVGPDGRTVYALRSAVDAPPAPVRLDAHTADQQPVPLQAPAAAPTVPGTLTEMTATAVDGTALRAWLVLPTGATEEPAPLLVWVHGGPMTSWNSWHWRWNPWLLAARGYAVLLPDPALSTGYGQAFLQRGWPHWGDAPYTDVLALADAAEARPDIDASRTAAMGGSFGGYMANWIAGHTDRFDAIVTHASLWALDQFGPTTDAAYYWSAEMTAEMAARNTPHAHVDKITTPMLVIHGDRDYRVPIGEGLRLWWELLARQADPETQPHRFLYFPDEGHWILKPRHAALWYETVINFLDHHLLEKEFRVPELLI
ncbi:MAG TPA: S9 family peptidase [Pseudonocardia sp.]|nr:S9 family peptidase [Pseudonocardia sp.]